MQMILEDSLDPTGLWTAADGAVRKLLLPNGRYLVKKGHAEWRQGDYAVTETHIEYHGDDGTTAAATITGGVIYSQSGIPLYAEDAE